VVDAANQLKEIRQTNASGALLAAMVYDLNGNLTRKCEGSGVTLPDASTCTGSMITSLSYNVLDQLVQVDKTGQASQTYAYDDQGRRIKKSVGSNVTQYLYNGMDIHGEYTTWSQASALYTHGPNTDDPLIRVAANDTRYYHQDGLGSVVATTDPNGTLTAAQLYDAWGNPYASAKLNTLPQYGYTGREPDETGLVYYRARYYDPSIGRFTQRDPIGLQGGINQYVYVENNPVELTDPEGLQAKSPVSGMMADSGKSYFSSAVSDFSGGFTGTRSVMQGPSAVAEAGEFARGVVDNGATAASLVGYALMALPGADILGGAILGTVRSVAVREVAEAEVGIVAKVGAEVVKRPSSFRKQTVQDAWDNARTGSSAGTKVCSTCSKEVRVAPGQGRRDWDVDHQPKWKDRDTTGMDRKQVLDEYNKNIRLRCPTCNRSDN
jgi:RHS repeat-associated protein